jgi:arabinogalactan oligomer/maltooligosaccharide transport system substrate-binding protein
MKKSTLVLGSSLVAASLILAACGGAAAPTSTSAPAATAAPTTAAAATDTAAPAATSTTAAAAATDTPAAVEATATTAAAEPTGSPTPEPTATTRPGATKITIWHQWDGKYLDAILAAFKDYEKAHPDIQIDLSKPNDVKNALNVAIPAGQGPDIIGWANDAIGDQALKGNIVALDDLGVDAAFMKSTYEPAAVAGVSWKDKIWALPETQEAIALVYNKDLVTDKYMPKDLPDLLTKATAFQKDNPGKTLVCNQAFGGNDAYHMAPIYFGFGVPQYVDEEGKGYLNTPEMIKGAQWLVDMSKVSLKENSYDICNAALKEGKVGMWWTGPWAIAAVEDNKVNYGILGMGRPFVGIKTMMISKNAVDRKTDKIALDIIKFYTSAEVQKKLSLANKTIPAATAALKDAEVAKLAAVIGFGTAANKGVPMSPSPFSSAQWDPVGKASQAVWTGAQKPDEAMAAAEKALDDAVANMK